MYDIFDKKHGEEVFTKRGDENSSPLVFVALQAGNYGLGVCCSAIIRIAHFRIVSSSSVTTPPSGPFSI